MRLYKSMKPVASLFQIKCNSKQTKSTMEESTMFYARPRPVWATIRSDCHDAETDILTEQDDSGRLWVAAQTYEQARQRVCPYPECTCRISHPPGLTLFGGMFSGALKPYQATNP